MRITLCSLFIVFLLSSCDSTTKITDKVIDINVLPIPKQLATSGKGLMLTAESRLFSPDKEVQPLLKLFQSELNKVTVYEIHKLDITDAAGKTADIVFRLDKVLDKETYRITIEEEVEVTGGSYRALAMARTTLLQLAHQDSGELYFPVLSIEDRPDAGYRGLMVDLARKWHSVETIKKIIDLASFYKSNYLQLHFSDYQSYTLPSNKYPKLPTPKRHYTFEQLADLENYASVRGITIIPEIDIPGHSSVFVEAYPEIFAIKNRKANPWIINMGKEEVYETIDQIFSEIIPIFKSSPYFHIGGDEAMLDKVMEDDDVKQYIQANNIDDDAHELYRHFIVRMNDIVKKHNKQMCVWEGFAREGKIQIPKDIVVFEFETNRYLPTDLIADGYTVVNTSWKPLYIVNEKKFEPKSIYDWNMWRWENWFPKAPSYSPIQAEKSPLVIGAQMCSWEQPEEAEFPSFRKRLPVMNERIWNTEKKVGYEKFRLLLEETDKLVYRLVGDSQQDTLLDGYNYVADKSYFD